MEVLGEVFGVNTIEVRVTFVVAAKKRPPGDEFNTYQIQQYIFLCQISL
jgi:hypothetical protein